ncbi:S-adenosyl-L-methionine-dependent methyltransferase [Dichotomocladium elegans]|nr:S-adenosyl-L-methionine-dependent methyltransferase [Dichotomocladium elegans]
MLKFVRLLEKPCIQNARKFSVSSARLFEKEALSPLGKHLHDSIKLTGPMTTAHYMRQVLVNPLSGFYMHRDVFGEQGDFVTSPEISQVFGELAGIWYLTEWMRLGQPKKTQLVELGPGRGTLMSDMLRALSRFPHFYETITGIHLVEASPNLRKMQRKLLTGDDTENPTESATRQDGIPVHWHDGLELVPQQWSLMMAHEFFDALAIHTFEKTEEGWRELLIDIDDTEDSEYNFRLVRSPVPTVASKAFMDANDLFKNIAVGERVEISPDSWNTVRLMAERAHIHGGSGLIIDYGQNYPQGSTLRAIRRHKIVHPMSDPGSADLSADVDFAALREAMRKYKDVNVFGPVTQSKFLQSLGIQARLEMLLKNTKSQETRHNLVKSIQRLIDPSMMGRIYKVMAFSKGNPTGSNVPVSFE